MNRGLSTVAENKRHDSVVDVETPKESTDFKEIDVLKQNMEDQTKKLEAELEQNLLDDAKKKDKSRDDQPRPKQISRLRGSRSRSESASPQRSRSLSQDSGSASPMRERSGSGQAELVRRALGSRSSSRRSSSSGENTPVEKGLSQVSGLQH